MKTKVKVKMSGGPGILQKIGDKMKADVGPSDNFKKKKNLKVK